MEEKNRNFLMNNWFKVALVVILLIAVGIYGYSVYRSKKSEEKSQTDISQLNPNVDNEKVGNESVKSLPEIIEEWSPRVALIACRLSLFNPDGSEVITGACDKLKSYGLSCADQFLSGSGFLKKTSLTKLNKTIFAIITNLHIITGHNGFSFPNSCEVWLPGDHIYKTNLNDVFTEDGKLVFVDGVPYWQRDLDYGFLDIKNPDSYTKQLAIGSESEAVICKEFPKIGDNIVILGYPTIGSNKGITATEGIISGIEDNYFVTSAKVEHGNSGGVAIFLKNDCYFGIPTYAISGEVESLARILDIRSFLQTP